MRPQFMVLIHSCVWGALGWLLVGKKILVLVITCSDLEVTLPFSSSLALPVAPASPGEFFPPV